MITFGSIFSRKKKSNFYIVLDVGTYSIRSLSIEQGAAGTIGLKKIVSALSPKEGGGLAPKIGTRLREILFRYIKGLGRIPDEVLLGLASKFTFNTLEVAKRVRTDKKRSVSKAEIEELLNQFVEDRKDFTKDSEKFVLAHAEPVHLVVDGYDVDPNQPRAIYGSTMELHLALNYVRNDFWKELEELKRILGGIAMDIRPSHMAVASFLTRKNPGADFLLIKIGGKITEVSGIKEGMLAWTETFAVGGEDITKSLAESLNITSARAEDIKKQYETLILPESVANSAKKIINRNVEDWLARLHGVLREKQFLLPDKIYLYGGGARLPRIKRALEEKAWAKDLAYQEAVVVKPIAAEDFTKNIFANQPLRGPEDVDLASLALTLVPPNLPNYKKEKLR